MRTPQRIPSLPARNHARAVRFALGAAVGLAQVLLIVASANGQAGMGVPTANLKVRVTDEEEEAPIERARVEVLKFPDGLVQLGFSDSSGLVEFYGLPPQTYVLRATIAGYLDAEVQVDLRQGEVARSVSLRMRKTQRDTGGALGPTVRARNLAIPESAQNEFQRGVRFLRDEKNPRQSVVHFQRAIEISPEYFEAYFLLGMTYIQLNLASEATAALEKSIALNPKFLSPYYPLAVLLRAQKRPDEAEKLLQRAMEMNKDGWEWPFELSRCYAARGQWEKALEYGQMAYDRPNPPTKIHLLMADLYSNLGSSKKAIAEFEIFLKLDPQSPYVPRVQKALGQLRKPE